MVKIKLKRHYFVMPQTKLNLRLLWHLVVKSTFDLLKIFHGFLVLISRYLFFPLGFPGGSDRKESACDEGGPGSIPGWGRSPGQGNGNPLQYSCLENSHGQRSLVGWSLKSMVSKRVGHDWATNTFSLYGFSVVDFTEGSSPFGAPFLNFGKN